MDKSKRMFDTSALSSIVEQGYYFVARYDNGTESKGHASEDQAIRAGKRKQHHFVVVRISLR
jgi:hypothetical protein